MVSSIGTKYAQITGGRIANTLLSAGDARQAEHGRERTREHGRDGDGIGDESGVGHAVGGVCDARR